VLDGYIKTAIAPFQIDFIRSLFFRLFLAAFLACLLLFFTMEIFSVIVLFVSQFLLKLFERAFSKVFIISNNESTGPALILLV
jgi:hypothetical protein